MLVNLMSELIVGYNSIQDDIECSCPCSCSSSKNIWRRKYHHHHHQKKSLYWKVTLKDIRSISETWKKTHVKNMAVFKTFLPVLSQIYLGVNNTWSLIKIQSAFRQKSILYFREKYLWKAILSFQASVYCLWRRNMISSFKKPHKGKPLTQT